MVLQYIMVLILLCLYILLVNILIIFFSLTFQNEKTKKVYVDDVEYKLTYAFKKGGTFPAIWLVPFACTKHNNTYPQLSAIYSQDF